ncbi:neutral zinc metallopeptidase [Microtetraspora sp. AC03309]|uniref:neutral zinc metallopeptidase n=1 Tax=Microtetraspora sp. AC03309 TaxID=2779376 RepID=UPI001E582444|nr:neutral zinc metallopeptidase [Microtetraspora sp. AC03309]
MISPRMLLALTYSMILTAACGAVGDLSEAPSKKPEKPASTSASACDVAGDDFAGDVELARCLTESFWAKEFQAAGGTYQPVQDFIAYDATSGPVCGGEKALPENAFYCPDGHFIAYDATWLRAMYDQMGDGAVYVVIPHEFGHAVQAQLENDFSYNVEQELQADCYAGATLGGLINADLIQAEEGDDAELLTNLEAAGDPTDAWWEPDAHGTPEKRQEAFATGFGKGVASC